MFFSLKIFHFPVIPPKSGTNLDLDDEQNFLQNHKKMSEMIEKTIDVHVSHQNYKINEILNKKGI